MDPKFKEKFHKDAKKFLKKMATIHLGLSKDQFDLRTNLAGPASLGETTLHTDTVYVQMGGLQQDILIRSCKGRKDYTGGRNHFKHVLDKEDEIAVLVKRCAGSYI